MMGDETMRCPKCGDVMHIIDDSSKTDGDVRVVDAICENCLYVTKVTVLVARSDDNGRS